ncbi:MAG: aminotransferase class I/II-fold pyridoxal phosphate-dependent enzyme [Campylobacter sp.]|nr:aminotransferase class I/II-fold pyridoxal phosphate-dependent enzyme [Campylobacter sp.]
MYNIPLYKPFKSQVGLDLISQVVEDNDTNIIYELEKTLMDYFNVSHVISTNNGTSAVHLSLCAMETKRADKFICSVNSFPNVAQCIRHFDAEPIFVDINEDDFNINLDAFEKTIKENQHKKLKGAFINHVAGQAADLKELSAIANKYGVKIINDANKGVGLNYENTKIGSCKDAFISCFQNHRQTKPSLANAGFITTNSDEISDMARLLRNYGLTTKNLKNQLNYVYDIVQIGQKYDIDAISAAYSLAQFKEIENLTQRRREIAEIYSNELADCTHITLPAAKKDHIFTEFIIKIDKNRDEFAKQLEEKGIETGLHYIPIHLLTYYKQKYNFKINDFPSALKVYSQILSLPIYESLSDEEVHYICKQIKLIATSRAY